MNVTALLLIYLNFIESCEVGDLSTVQSTLEQHSFNQTEMDKALAYSANHPHIVNYLMSQGAHITAGALTDALSHENEDMIRFFLDRNVDVLEATYYFAISSKGRKYFDILEEYGHYNDRACLKAAVVNNNIELVEICLNRVLSHLDQNSLLQEIEFLDIAVSPAIHSQYKDVALMILKKRMDIYYNLSLSFSHHYMMCENYWLYIHERSIHEHTRTLFEIPDQYQRERLHFTDLKMYLDKILLGQKEVFNHYFRFDAYFLNLKIYFKEIDEYANNDSFSNYHYEL